MLDFSLAICESEVQTLKFRKFRQPPPTTRVNFSDDFQTAKARRHHQKFGKKRCVIKFLFGKLIVRVRNFAKAFGEYAIRSLNGKKRESADSSEADGLLPSKSLTDSL